MKCGRPWLSIIIKGQAVQLCKKDEKGEDADEWVFRPFPSALICDCRMCSIHGQAPYPTDVMKHWDSGAVEVEGLFTSLVGTVISVEAGQVFIAENVHDGVRRLGETEPNGAQTTTEG